MLSNMPKRKSDRQQGGRGLATIKRKYKEDSENKKNCSEKEIS